MLNSKTIIERAIINALKQNKSKVNKGMRSARRSYLSMDNLDIEEENEEDEQSDPSLSDEELGSPKQKKSDTDPF
jgi:hypothetical protein